ncbi:PREDICTED: basic proline-rich protein-like [Lipotes vexillifer]|uniref:Basic proline-rich protein-like n=1 Tax=Lipotes vexillifer TaxID=118797 RepID=A0A340Y9A4_LIPVE|nr:PREDICTED: basic proline-rich protein-like [Lipotes vexillifer]
MPKFQAGLGPARFSRPPAPALRHLPGQPWSAPSPPGPARGPGTAPTWSPLTPRGHGSGSRSRSSEGGGVTRQGVGRKISPKRTRRTRARQRGEAAGRAGTPPARHLSAAGRSTAGGRGPAGRGSADSRLPKLGGARLPASPPPPPARPPGPQGPAAAGTRRQLGCGASPSFCPRASVVRRAVRAASPLPRPESLLKIIVVIRKVLPL